MNPADMFDPITPTRKGHLVALVPMHPPADFVPWDNEDNAPEFAVVADTNAKVLGLFSSAYFARTFSDACIVPTTVRKVAR